MAKLAPRGGKKTMITLTIKDKAVLHKCYMLFVKNGGLFIANRTEYDLEDDVFILLTLMDESEKIPVAGRVVWIAKKGVKSPHTPGVGIQFSDPENIARDKIETYLVGSLSSANATATM